MDVPPSSNTLKEQCFETLENILILSIIKFLEVFGGQPALSALLRRVNDFHRVVRIYSSNAIKKIEERLELAK